MYCLEILGLLENKEFNIVQKRDSKQKAAHVDRDKVQLSTYHMLLAGDRNQAVYINIYECRDQSVMRRRDSWAGKALP